MTPIQIEWAGGPPPILVARTFTEGVYWVSTRWFGQRYERLILREDLEDFYPPEVLELVDAE